MRLSNDGKPMFHSNVLKVKVGIETSSRLSRRRTSPLFRFSPILLLEIGSLANLIEFSVAWRAPNSCVDFHVDPLIEDVGLSLLRISCLLLLLVVRTL